MKAQEAFCVVYGQGHNDKYVDTAIRGHEQLPIFWTRSGAKQWVITNRGTLKDYRIVRVTIEGIQSNAARRGQQAA